MADEKVKKNEKSVLERIQNVKLKLLEANLKKSGENKFAGFKYYELADILPSIIKFCNEERLFTKVTFDKEVATLVIYGVDNLEDCVVYTSPMKDLELKGCNSIQALGGVETYQRRYLYMMAFDIVENDMFDSLDGKDEKSKEKMANKVQIDRLNKINNEEAKQYILNQEKISSFEELTFSKASEYIKASENKGWL